MRHTTHGKVPHFQLRPHPVILTALGFTLVIGLLGALSFFHKEDGTGEYSSKGFFILIVTLIISICLTIIATSKMWFTHLWKKNSSHARHKQHSHHHPMVREQNFRKNR